jgi:hypothetical protein
MSIKRGEFVLWGRPKHGGPLLKLSGGTHSECVKSGLIRKTEGYTEISVQEKGVHPDDRAGIVGEKIQSVVDQVAPALAVRKRLKQKARDQSLLINLLCDSSEDAEDAGEYAVFNGGPHLCVDVPEGAFTISCRNAQGRKVTFAFVAEPSGKGHQCIDIVHHTGGKTVKNGGSCDVPVMQASMHTIGHAKHIATYKEREPVVLISLSLKPCQKRDE